MVRELSRLGRRHDSEAVRLTLGAFVIVTELIFMYSMASAGIEFLLSSFVLTTALLLQLRFGIRRDEVIVADIVVYIFNWLFLDLAPKIQLLSMPDMLVNTSPVLPRDVLITNLLCAVFIVAFTLVYALLGRRRTAVPADPAPMGPSFSGFGVLLALTVCIVVVAALGRTPYQTDPAVVIAPSEQVIKKFLLFLPSATLMIFLHEAKRSGRPWVFTRVCVMLALIALVLITENPLTEKRNGLGPVYLGLIFIVFEQRLRGLNRRLLLLVASMMLVFPAITVLTHSHHQFLNGVKLQSVIDTLKDHYFSVNYDAWANTYTTVEMVQREGVSWGRQLLGDFLFFVPSSIWHGKPIATGIAIGNYLITHHSGWFTNLSAPLVAEAYIDFGVIGVVLYGAGLAAVVVFLNRSAAMSRRWAVFPLAVYTSLFLMFVLRGSLMIAFAYGAGAYMAFLVASVFLSSGQRRIGQRFFIAPPMPSGSARSSTQFGGQQLSRGKRE